MGTRKARQRSPLTITAASAGGAVALALVLGPVASAATSTAGAEVAAARHGEAAAAERSATAHSAALRSAARKAQSQAAAGLALAETGSIDTTPYLMGGTAFLVLGTGMLVAVRRRESPTG